MGDVAAKWPRDGKKTELRLMQGLSCPPPLSLRRILSALACACCLGSKEFPARHKVPAYAIAHKGFVKAFGGSIARYALDINPAAHGYVKESAMKAHEQFSLALSCAGAAAQAPEAPGLANQAWE
jgi:hypothetical protein